MAEEEYFDDDVYDEELEVVNDDTALEEAHK